MFRGKLIKIIIRADGSVTVDAINFPDATCTQVTQQILSALGGTVSEERLKPEAQRLPPQANPRMEGAR